MAKMVYYSGEVQGVGLRMSASVISRFYPVTGWVRNLPDGRVQLLAEGPEQVVEAFLRAIRERWQDHIELEQVIDQPPTGAYARFEVVGRVASGQERGHAV